jgi:hypothetical protein
VRDSRHVGALVLIAVICPVPVRVRAHVMLSSGPTRRLPILTVTPSRWCPCASGGKLSGMNNPQGDSSEAEQPDREELQRQLDTMEKELRHGT